MKPIYHLIYLPLFITALPELDKSYSEPTIVGAEEEVLLDCKVKNLANYTVIWKYVDVVKSSRDKLLTVGEIRVTGDDRFSVLHQPGKLITIGCSIFCLFQDFYFS